jgi:hypothetical protein
VKVCFKIGSRRTICPGWPSWVARLMHMRHQLPPHTLPTPHISLPD